MISGFIYIASRERFRSNIMYLWTDVVPARLHVHNLLLEYSSSVKVGIVGHLAISAIAQTGALRVGNINVRVTLLRVSVCVHVCVYSGASS